jgi:hypothetical protein
VRQAEALLSQSNLSIGEVALESAHPSNTGHPAAPLYEHEHEHEHERRTPNALASLFTAALIGASIKMF